MVCIGPQRVTHEQVLPDTATAPLSAQPTIGDGRPTPLWFGDIGQEAFGWWHPPTGRARGATQLGPAGAVVIVGPVGYEAVCAHRAVRAMARALAASGFGVLRYDHPGTGDSAGDDHERTAHGWTTAWLRAVPAAIERATAQLPGVPVTVIGVRVGALLASVALGERADVGRLVLVAPCATGRGYLRELRARHACLGLPDPPSDAPSPEGAESLGFLWRPDTAAAIERLDLARTAHPPDRRVLIVERDDQNGDGALVRSLVASGVQVESKRLPGYTEMMRDPHQTAVPELMIAGIRQWLEREGAEPPQKPAAADVRTSPCHPHAGSALIASAGRAATMPHAGSERDGLLLDGGSGTLRERVFRFGPSDALFGVLTTPAAGSARRTGIVLLNAGSTSHVGPGRMWVRWARAWATLGYTVLRMDVAGIGDSPAAGPGADDNHPYAPGAVEDVQHALGAVARRAGLARFVVGGLCSGAYLSFHAALTAGGVVGALLVNPVTFAFRPGMSLELPAIKAFKRTERYKRVLFRRETWSRVWRGQIDGRLVARSIRDRVSDVVGAKLAPLLGGNALPNQLRSLDQRGVDGLFVFSEGEPGLDQLQLHGGRAFRRLCESGRFVLHQVPAADHTFTAIWSQRRVQDLLTQHLLDRHG